jgi:hypothetical protein
VQHLQEYTKKKRKKQMASTKTLIIGGGVCVALLIGTYFYGVSNAAKGLSINTFARIHHIDVLGETTISIDIEFINGSQNNIAFTYPYVRVFRADSEKQIAFSVPKDEKITVAKSSTTTVKDIRIKMNTLDLAGLAMELIKNIAVGKPALIPLQIQIDSQLVGLISVNFTLTDKAEIDISKYLNLIKGLFGKGTNGINGLGCDCQTQTGLQGTYNQAAQHQAHLIAANHTLIGVVADDNKTVVNFEVPKHTYLGKFPKPYNNQFSTFQTPYGDRAIGANKDMIVISEQ